MLLVTMVFLIPSLGLHMLGFGGLIGMERGIPNSLLGSEYHVWEERKGSEKDLHDFQ